MIKYVTGNLLEAEDDIIGHQVNCMNAFGAGLAGQIRSKYPNVYDEYTALCGMNKDNRSTLLGHVQFVEVGDNKYVANLFSQLNYGRQKILYTDYPSLKLALTELRDVADEHRLSVALPKFLGCGLAGGDWEIVSKIIEEAFDGYSVTVYELG